MAVLLAAQRDPRLRHLSALADRPAGVAGRHRRLGVTDRTPNRIEVSAGILSFRDFAGAGVRVPNPIGYAGLSGDDAPVTGISLDSLLPGNDQGIPSAERALS